MRASSSEAGPAIPWFGTRYYNKCHALFRRLTDQPQRMLEDIRAICGERPCDRILSVGSGTGLFEIPMLEMLLSDGTDPQLFVGIDINREACNQLSLRLEAAQLKHMEWQVLPQAFEGYAPTERFDVVMFNHSFEYLSGPPARWVRKALGLLTEDGICLIYSPDRGDINAPYADMAEQAYGLAPRFSDDLKRALGAEGIHFAEYTILGMCSVEPLARPDQDEERTQLLSFLCQIDCREVGREARASMADYYLGLSVGGERTIPHPTTRFLISQDGHGVPGH